MQVKLIQTQKVLSRTQISLADYVINPYRGCEFGCLYCYAKGNKNVQGKDIFGGEFLGVKINAPHILEKELTKIRPKRVLLGSITECFQPLEKEYKITRQILTILHKNNIPYTILTKSSLIKKHLEIISQNKKNKIYFTLNIAEQKYINLLEKNSSSLVERLNAIKEIISAGIDLRIHIGPYIPGISSMKEILKILPQGINEVDIELYHNTMGQFKKILDVLGDEKAKKLREIYSRKEKYSNFGEGLRKKIEDLKKETGLNFFFIQPDYKQFYSSKIDYSKKL